MLLIAIFQHQVNLHPSILPEDFDITPNGELILNLPPGKASSGARYLNFTPSSSVQQVHYKSFP
jgi:hypothetical protein